MEKLIYTPYRKLTLKSIYYDTKKKKNVITWQINKWQRIKYFIYLSIRKFNNKMAEKYFDYCLLEILDDNKYLN